MKMNKKLTATALAAVMTLASAQGVFAATQSEIKTKLTELVNSGVTQKYVIDADNNGAVKVKDAIKVETGIKVKEHGANDSTYAQNTTVILSSASETRAFDFKATLKMDKVKKAFTSYIELAKKYANCTDEDIKDLDVKGQFKVKIKYPQEYFQIPTETVSNTNMSDFSSDNGVFTETVQRAEGTDGTFKTLTITIDIDKKADVLMADVDNAFADLELSSADVKVLNAGTYNVTGEVTGEITVGSEKLAIIPFEAVQEGTANGVVQATITSRLSSGSTSLGGGSSSKPSTTVKKANIKFLDGTKEYFKDTVELEDGKYVLDLSSVANPTSDGNKVFEGWYTDKELTKKAADKTVITGDTTFYAKWIDLKHDVKFNVDGVNAPVNTGKTGSIILKGEDVVLDGDKLVIDLDALSIKGYTITGWFTDPEFKNPVSGKIEITDDTVLYATTQEIKVPAELDVDGDHFAYVVGYPEGDVRPNNTITREEVATLFFRLLTDESRNANLTDENSFVDVNADRWSNKAISTMAKLGIINGYENDGFKPEQGITRAEFAAIAARFAEEAEGKSTFADVSGHWAEEYVAKAVAMQWINGYDDGTFRPEDKITRAEAIAIVNRILKRSVSSENIIEGAVKWNDNGPAAWYYEDIIEATNSHKFERVAEGKTEEKWTEIIENKDWTSLQ